MNIKLKPVLSEQIEEENKEKERIKKQYGIEPDEQEKIVVVEKTAVWNKLTAILRLVLNVIIYVLGSVGVFCLLYPNIRSLFFKELIKIIRQYLPFLVS